VFVNDSAPPVWRQAAYWLEQNMSTHKFAVGQTLHFSPGPGEDSNSKGRYKVVQQLPEAGNMLQYCIKSELGGQERVVREDQIERRR
jgi:hypothetical protein